MLGLDGVQGSQSVSWQVIIHFYLRDWCSLISHLFLLLSLLFSFSLKLSWTHLQLQEGTVRSFFKLLIVSAGNIMQLGHPLDLKASFRLWTPVSWSIFWDNSSSKTLQRCTRWTLHSSMVQKRKSLITKHKAACEHTFSPLTDSRSQECTGYSIKGTPYVGLKRQAVPNPCVTCLFCNCGYRCCKTREIICLKITWHNQDSTRWGFWFLSTWEKGGNIKRIAHALKNL